MSLKQIGNNFWVKVLRYILTHIFLFIFPLAVLTAISIQLAPWYTREFWIAVIINMLPGIIIIAIIWWLAARFVQTVYELNSIGQGINFVMRHQFGQLGFSPFMILGKGKVELDPNGMLTRGGPASLIINNDTAVVLEKCGQLTRVEGPGFPTLEPFEKIYDIIDLRPKRWVYSIEAMTKEGIPVTWDVEVQYQIDDGGQNSTGTVPYPFSNEAVLRAATGTWRRERGQLQEMDWEGWVIVSQTEGILRSILAKHSLNELIGLTEGDQLAARELIQQELGEKLGEVAPERGAKILEVKLDNLKVGDEVTQQWIQEWQSHWQHWSTNQLAKEEAKYIQDYEMAKAKAQIRSFNMPTTEFQTLNSNQDITPLILMRLISALDQARLENELFPPGEALAALEKLQKLLGRGNALEEDDNQTLSWNGNNGGRSSIPR